VCEPCDRSGGAKSDIIVDEKKVEEAPWEVRRKKWWTIMALLGDTIDNIPGAKGIGRKSAA